MTVPIFNSSKLHTKIQTLKSHGLIWTIMLISISWPNVVVFRFTTSKLQKTGALIYGHVNRRASNFLM